MDHMCNLCNKSFTSSGNLNRHLLIHSEEKPHVCNICNRSFSQKHHLTTHLFTHSGENPHVCNICSKSFTQKHHLKLHLLIHSGEKPHVCSICSKSFTQKRDLRRHSLIHSEEKPHVCNICNKSFALKHQLKRHLLLHIGEKPHVCNICNKSFTLKGNLKQHSLIHSGVKPICNICNKSFNREETLIEHSLIDICSKCFPQKSILKSHSQHSGNSMPGKIEVKEEIVDILKKECDTVDDDDQPSHNVRVKSDINDGNVSFDLKKENVMENAEVVCSFEDRGEDCDVINNIENEINEHYEEVTSDSVTEAHCKAYEVTGNISKERCDLEFEELTFCDEVQSDVDFKVNNVEINEEQIVVYEESSRHDFY